METKEDRITSALKQSGEGNQAAFAEVVREYQSMVYSLAFHFLRDGARAEELAQEVFLELYQNVNKMESAAHAKNWLRKVTSFRCIDLTRRLKVRRHCSLEEAPEPSVNPDSRDPFLRKRLGTLVCSLPARSRMVVILRYQEGMELAEVARTLDMPLNTVKSHLQRSLSLLRDKIRALRENNAYELPRR